MSTLRIRLLGGFSLEHEGVVLPPLANRTARSLLALLVIQRDLPHSRDLLAGTFWPDLPEARARRRLSHALWQVQQLLKEVHGPAPFVVVDADTVAFNSDADFWLDVDEFERLGTGTLSEIERAIELYRGDLLAGLYEDWMLLERQGLRRQYADLLRRATDGYKSLGELDRALTFARRLVAHNPLAEEAQRDVMRLSFLIGEFNDAIQQYEFCASILEEELGASPAAETQALFEMIVAQRAKGDRPFVPDPRSPLFAARDAIPMVGRVDERAAVLERMAGAFGGRGGVVLVEGPLGVGISRFLDGLAEDAHWRGLGVLSATARSAGTPYELGRSALGDALSPLRIEQLTTMVDRVWLRAASAIFPALAPPGSMPERLNPEDESGRIGQALSEILLGFGTISPHVVIMDDVHLADPETLAFLRQAARRLYASNLLVILGYHSAEARLSQPVWSALQDIDALRGAERLTLQELDRVETAELARLASAGPVNDALLDALFVQTGGNPLLILEGLRDAARDDVDTAALTDVAADLLWRRLRSAPPLTLRTLQGAAIFEGAITPDGISRAAGLSRNDVLSGVYDAVRKVFLVDADGEVAFAHAQLRTATLATIDSADLVGMHAEAAQWLESNQPDRHEELARHYLAAGSPERAVVAFRNAASQAEELFATDTASAHLRSALAAAQEARIPDVDVVETLLHLESLADQRGRRDEQAGILERVLAADVSGVELRLEAMRRRVLVLANTDRYEEAEAAAIDAQRLGEDAGLPIEGVLTAHGLALSWSGRSADALPYLRQAADGPDLDAGSAAEIRHALGMALSSLDDPLAQPELERALHLFEEAGQPRRVADVIGLMATNDGSRGEVGLAEARFREAFDICRRIGFTKGAGIHLTNLAALHYLDGRPAEALRGFDAALESLSIVSDNRHEAMTLNNAAFVRHRIVGDDAAADEAARRALEYYRSADNPRGAAQSLAILSSIEARHDPEAALQLFTEEFDDVEPYGAWTAAHLRLRQAEVHLALGRLDSARRFCDEASEWAASGELGDVAASVESVSASIALATGNQDEALAGARRSVDLLGRGVPRPYMHHFGLYLAAKEHSEREAALSAAYSGLQVTLAGFSPTDREQAATVPEHAAIIEAWAARHPVTRTITLKTAGGTGTIEATLTVDEPKDRAIAGKRSRRLHRVKRLVGEASRQGIKLSSQDLAALLGVSPATIRRDLATIRTERS